MSIYFNATDHSYKSLAAEDNIDWISVTTLVSHFKKSFWMGIRFDKTEKRS